MATKALTRSIFTIHRSIQVTKQSLTRSYTNISLSTQPSFLFRQRPLVALAASLGQSSSTATNLRAFSTRQTTSSLNDSSPNWSNRPPKETILLDGCDFEHWLIVMEKPEGDPTRDDIIDSYIKTLAQVVGSEDEARMKIYSVSTKHYFAFGALVSEEVSYKIKELPRVRWVLPDSYLDVRNKDYGGEPFINGQAVPYDPKYHEEWVRNNARANERNRRNDRPRNFDRSRNFERRRENMQPNRAPNMGGGPPNMGGGPPNMGGGPPNVGGAPPNMGGGPPNMGGAPPNMGGGPPNMGGAPPNMGGMPPQQGNMGGMPPQQGNMGGGMPPVQGNMGGMQQGNMGGSPYSGGMRPNMGGPPPSYGAPPAQNYGGQQSNYGPPPPNYGNVGGAPNNVPNFQQRDGPNSGGVPPYQQGPSGYQNAPQNIGGGNYSRAQDMPGRDNY